MKLILFDLDGTLLTAGGIGRKATRTALESVFGDSGNLDAFYPGGRTQEAIFLDTLLDAGYSQDDYLFRRTRLYRIFLAEFRKDIQQRGSQIQSLPGAVDLIRSLSENPTVVLGMVTGNHRENASLKLRQAGFSPEWFAVGAYGEESAIRSKLILLAQKRAREKSGVEFTGKRTIVVGDTTRDVISARENGAVSVAVSTGTDDRALLETAAPDYILEGLEDRQTVLEILLSASHALKGGINGI